MIVVTKDLYTLRSWEGQDTESLTLHLNNKKHEKKLKYRISALWFMVRQSAI